MNGGACFLLSQLILNWFNHSRRIPTYNNVIWNIFCYNSTRSNNDIVSDGHTWIDDGSSSYPNMVPKLDWFPVFKSTRSFVRINWMRRSIDMHPGPSIQLSPNVMVHTSKNTASKFAKNSCLHEHCSHNHI